MFRQKVYDTALVLKTPSIVKTSGMATKSPNGTTGGLGAVVTLDIGTGWTQGAFVVQIAANADKGAGTAQCTYSTGGQHVVIELRGSSTKTFVREYPLAVAHINLSSIGAARHGGTSLATLATGTTTEIILPFTNEWNNTQYQYLRCYHTFLGTCGTGINYSAWLSKF